MGVSADGVPYGCVRDHEARAERERCIAIALGCRDYSGGYRGAELEAYHAGMETVARALGSPGVDFQRRVVEAIGREAMAQPTPGEAVRPRVGAWFEGGDRTWGRLFSAGWENGGPDDAAYVTPSGSVGWRWITWAPKVGEARAHGIASTLDAAKAAADAALEAAGYELEGGAHVDPEDDEAARARAFVARARAFMAPELAAEVARLTAERDEVAKALGDCWVAGRPMMDAIRALEDAHGERVDTLITERADARAKVEQLTFERDDALAESATRGALLNRIRDALGEPHMMWHDAVERVERAARHDGPRRALADVARVLRCEPGDVAGAALAALEQAALARGEAAGLERALRVLAEVRRG